MDNGVKIELLGIGIILLGIALSTHNLFATVLGIIGFSAVASGCYWKGRGNKTGN